MLLVAADACWGPHGAAARRQLLPNKQLKAMMRKCLDAVALPCRLGMPLGSMVRTSVVLCVHTPT
jgi:hypothetical protein